MQATSRLANVLGRLDASTTGELWVATPFLSRQGLDELLDELHLSTLKNTRWIVRWDAETALGGFTDGQALLKLLRDGAQVRHLANLHAKVYLRPRSALVAFGSANLTLAGLHSNEEIVRFSTDAREVDAITGYYEQWWSKALALDEEQIQRLLSLYQPTPETEHQYQSWLRLASLGAYASISHEVQNLTWRVRIPWSAFDLRRPSLSDGTIAPARLLVVPKLVQELAERSLKKCRKNRDQKSIRHGPLRFLLVTEFDSLRKSVTLEEECLNGQVRRIPKQLWQDHKRRLTADLEEWFTASERGVDKDELWIRAQVSSLSHEIPEQWPNNARIRLLLNLELPHPSCLDRDGDTALDRLMHKAEARIGQGTLSL